MKFEDVFSFSRIQYNRMFMNTRLLTKSVSFRQFGNLLGDIVNIASMSILKVKRKSLLLETTEKSCLQSKRRPRSETKSRRVREADAGAKMISLVKAERYTELLEFIKVNQDVRRFYLNSVLELQFGKCNLTQEILAKEKILDIMWDRGIVPDSLTMTHMVRLYGKQNDANKIERVLQTMESNGIEKCLMFYNAAITALGKRIQRIQEIHQQIKDSGFVLTLQTFNVLIKAYSRAGRMTLVEETLNDMSREGLTPNKHIYTTLFSAYTTFRDPDRVTALFQEMREKSISPDVVCYNSLLKAHGAARDFERMISTFASMAEDGIQPDMYSYFAMIQAYIQAKEVSKAEQIYSHMLEDGIQPSLYPCNAMIKAYADLGNFNMVDNVRERMERAGVSPDLLTFTAILIGYTRWKRSIYQIDSLRREMRKYRIESDILFCNRIIAAYAKADAGYESIHRVEDVLATMRKTRVKPSVVTYNEMILTYSNGGLLEKSIEMFNEITSVGLEPTLASYTVMMQAYFKAGENLRGEELFKEMQANRIIPGIRAFNALLEMYAKAANVEKVKGTLDLMREHRLFGDTETVNIVLLTYIRSGDYDVAFNLWTFIRDGRAPESFEVPVFENTMPEMDKVTICTALELARRAGRVEDSHDIWMFAQNKSDLRLDSTVLNSYLEVLVSAGDDEAGLAIDLVAKGMNEEMPLRCVKPGDSTFLLLKEYFVRYNRPESLLRKLEGVLVD